MSIVLAAIGVAFAAFCVWLGVRIFNRRERWAKWTALAIAAVLAAYPLGIKPAVWLMEREWMPQMKQMLGLDASALPAIWDADFLYGPRNAAGEDTYVLCEINVSSVFPDPEQAPAEIARLATQRLSQVASRSRTR